MLFSLIKSNMFGDSTMIRCHLARMMGEHKMRIADVARETGLSRATLTLLYKETAQKVDLEVIDKLCAFFDCEIGELLERFPSAAQVE